MKKERALEIEALIMNLLSRNVEIGIQEVAEASGLSKTSEGDRKAIRRVFNALIDRGQLKAKGAARARVYIRAEQPLLTAEMKSKEEDSAFKLVSLSADSKKLLHYISQPLAAKTPVGYQQNFLRSYVPNETRYLTKAEQENLLSLGRVESQTRPAGTYARNILNRLLIDLSWNSSRLEGNTYSLLETKRLIEFGENATGKNATEAQMILNHKEAIEYIVEASKEETVSSHDICSIHALLSENLLGDPGASGRVRQVSVGISGTVYFPIDNPHVLRECFDVFIEKFNRIENPFEQSLFSLVHLSYMQAFEDVNKRTARLVSNIPLIRKNLRPLSFAEVQEEAYVKALLGVYEKNDISLIKDLYIWAYSRSSQQYSAVQQSMGEPNLLKLKYRSVIQDIVKVLILERVVGSKLMYRLQNLIEERNLPEVDGAELLKIIETEIANLHDGNIARFKVRPSEFEAWKNTR